MARLERRHRNKEIRKRKSFVVIACEGKNRTETIYFNNYASRKCIIKFATGIHTNPLGMAKDLVKYMKNEDISIEYGDKIYLLIDTDINENKNEQIKKAREICDKNGIELITSIPTFEVWYLLHFGFMTKVFQSSKQVKDNVKEKMKNYSESMNIFPKIMKKTNKAIENAKKLEKFHIENGKNLFSDECNPYTGVYKIVEELENRNRDNE